MSYTPTCIIYTCTSKHSEITEHWSSKHSFKWIIIAEELLEDVKCRMERISSYIYKVKGYDIYTHVAYCITKSLEYRAIKLGHVQLSSTVYTCHSSMWVSTIIMYITSPSLARHVYFSTCAIGGTCTHTCMAHQTKLFTPMHFSVNTCTAMKLDKFLAIWQSPIRM